MSAPIVVLIPHRLGKAEASRRLKEGLGGAGSDFGNLLSVKSTAWAGDRVSFQVRTLGQTATGSIDVFDRELRLELTLPWLLGKLADRIIPALRQGTVLLLEKK
jgi:hypothetical protein